MTGSDERDVILFSVTYGPDQDDYITMNFGPLNRSGGERRLNVAMTRARSEMIVFSTMKPERIDLSRSKARAVADLKHFLEYAERGPNVLGAQVKQVGDDYESPFEAAVARALKDKGWDVHSQIGVSAYRIDLGVLHPDFPGKYLAGIECDGAMYHSSAFARERDKIRQAVLEGLGWKLQRIWSTDWWTNKGKALERIHQELTTLYESEKKSPTTTKKSNAKISDASFKIKKVSSDSKPVTLDQNVLSAVSSLAHFEESRTSSEEYEYANLAALESNPDAFYSQAYLSVLSEMIAIVIDTEGPVHAEVLTKRIARHHGFQRVGNQIRDLVLKISTEIRTCTEEEERKFFWPKNACPEKSPARYKNRDEELRNLDFICREEIHAINQILNLSADASRLAKAIGIGRLSKEGKMRLEKILC